MSAWITVIGVGDDGVAGLAPSARALIDTAELLVGGDRHQRMVAETTAERLTWVNGLDAAMDEMERWHGRHVVVLATGDPMYYGAGANLRRRFDADDMVVLPFPGAFSLAAARMLWSLADVERVTIHGRPLEILNLAFQPGARVIALSRDGGTPAQAARLLTERGFGPSAITVLENMGGPEERRIDGVAERWDHPRCADLNTLAIECRAGPDAQILPPVPGLPDSLFESDGQLTKREVRAVTVSALAPLPGQVLWDVGAGSGSVAIEWLRAAPNYRNADGQAARAVAVERDVGRAAMAARNATALGVPQLTIVQDEAPDALTGLEPAPDTIFVGGGISREGLLEACWQRLLSGGRMVANAVTVEGEARLAALRAAHGGDLTRIAVSHAEPVGRLTAFRSAMDVTQYIGVKS